MLKRKPPVLDTCTGCGHRGLLNSHGRCRACISHVLEGMLRALGAYDHQQGSKHHA